MIIYKDALSGDELFSDAYKITESSCGTYYIFHGKWTTVKTDDIDDSLIGGNASAEEQQEQMDENSKSDFDFAMACKLQCSERYKDNKSGFKGYLKAYFKKVVDHLQKTKPDQVEQCKKDAMAFCKKMLDSFDNLSIYFGEHDDENEYCALIVEWNEDGESGKVYAFKAAIIEEKV